MQRPVGWRLQHVSPDLWVKYHRLTPNSLRRTSSFPGGPSNWTRDKVHVLETPNVWYHRTDESNSDIAGENSEKYHCSSGVGHWLLCGLYRNTTVPVRLFACKVVSHFAVISNPSVMFRYSPQSVPDTGTAAAVAFLWIHSLKVEILDFWLFGGTFFITFPLKLL